MQAAYEVLRARGARVPSTAPLGASAKKESLAGAVPWNRVHALICERDRQTKSSSGTLRRPDLIGQLQHSLHLSRSLGGGTQAHRRAPDSGIRDTEISMVESVEHLDAEL